MPRKQRTKAADGDAAGRGSSSTSSEATIPVKQRKPRLLRFTPSADDRLEETARLTGMSINYVADAVLRTLSLSKLVEIVDRAKVRDSGL